MVLDLLNLVQLVLAGWRWGPVVSRHVVVENVYKDAFLENLKLDGAEKAITFVNRQKGNPCSPTVGWQAADPRISKTGQFHVPHRGASEVILNAPEPSLGSFDC